MPGECIVYVDGSIVLGLASIRCDIDLVLPCGPRGGASGPKNASSCSMSLGGNAEGSGWVVIIPRVSSNENVRRIGSHGRKLGSAPST